MERLAKGLSQSLIVVAGIATIVMLVIIVADVISKAFFSFAIPGVDTIVASYLMVAVIFLPLAMLELIEENIAVDVLYNVMPVVLRRLCAILGHVLTILFYLLLAWLYLAVAIEAFEIREFVTGSWNVPIWPARIIMPIGLTFAAAAAIVKLLLILKNLIKLEPETTDHGHTDGDFL